MVTFVSECEKKALNRTRRVLDAFANRIGSRTWQTVITEEGLQAVKKLLRKTATKNTAVACHWIRSRSRSELVWVVGNRSKFNREGIVPVNSTQKTIWQSDMSADWHALPLIKSLTALAALFHDWGKASEYFQDKLASKNMTGDPLRHEWISTLFLNAYVNGESEDKPWLTRLAEGKIEIEDLKKSVCDKHDQSKEKNKPLHKLPPAASVLAWLIVSHHRLPVDERNVRSFSKPHQFKDLFKVIDQKWGYENIYNEQEYQNNLSRCFDYPKGLPSQSDKWRQYAQRNAKKLLELLPLLEQAIADGSWRIIVHHARLALMLGDHYYSSQEKDKNWKSNLDLYANTDKSHQLKQRLDEHLVIVAKQAVRNVHLLPAFEGQHQELQRAFDIKPLKQKSPIAYRWQDTAVIKISDWREQHKAKLNPHHFGFFAVNMASTGQGKTFANAKIMRALSIDAESLRYILALGLRTLTLQTGDEYRKRIKLEDDELAVLIGSRAVLELHALNQSQKEDVGFETGSESEESLLDNEIDFSSSIPDDQLATALTTLKSRQFLYAPVLACTIDHLMAATETKRGGRFILPALRLMSSDLVIDEIDDFDGKDLIAIGRLIHLAGMLGRKVMISSATIPPDLAEGFFNAYQEGWSLFARHRNRSQMIGCAWIDEKTTHIESINSQACDQALEWYRQQHQDFVAKRVKMLLTQVVKRKAGIVPVAESDGQTQTDAFFNAIKTAIVEKHRRHCFTDEQTGKSISIGLVRMANINPCVQLTRFLLNAEWPESIDIRCMAYHSQQTLIMRNEQEKHLDQILKRHSGDKALCHHPVIRQHLDSTNGENLIFILVATPVEEVGRDHDFDWAVVEPSSYRSIIQLAGRILRHRSVESAIEHCNIGLLQYNLKGFLGQEKVVFRHPGYESNANKLKTHDLTKLVNTEELAKRVDAQARISKSEQLQPETNLADLEHCVIQQLLTHYTEFGPASLQGWLQSCWWLTAIPQQLVKFREGNPQATLFLVEHEGEWKFAEKNKFGKPVVCEQIKHIHQQNELSAMEQQRLWLYRDYRELLEVTGKPSAEEAALVYGEINIPDDEKAEFIYSEQFGITKSIKETTC